MRVRPVSRNVTINKVTALVLDLDTRETHEKEFLYYGKPQYKTQIINTLQKEAAAENEHIAAVLSVEQTTEKIQLPIAEFIKAAVAYQYKQEQENKKGEKKK